MTSSSDSDIELEQRSQPKRKNAPSEKVDGTSPKTAKTPWDLMRAKSNKAFSKSYLQEMIDGSPKLGDVLKSPGTNEKEAKNPSPPKMIQKRRHDPLPEDEDDDDSFDDDDDDEIVETAPVEVTPPTDAGGSSTVTQKKSKKVYFSDTVRKRDIEVSASEDDLDDDTDPENLPVETLTDSDERLSGGNAKTTQCRKSYLEESISSYVKKSTKKSSKLNCIVSKSKDEPKFTITQNAGGRSSISSESGDSSPNSSHEEPAKTNLKDSLPLQNYCKNEVVNNKKIRKNTESTSSNSENEEVVAKIKATTNSKYTKKTRILKLPLEVTRQNDTSSSEHTDRADTSSSDNKKIAAKYRVTKKKTTKTKNISSNKPDVNKKIHYKQSTINKYKTDESSSNEDSKKQVKKISRNTSLTKTNKSHSNSSKELKNKTKETLSDSNISNTDNDVKKRSYSINKDQLSESESSGKEFVRCKSSTNSSPNKSLSLIKKSPLSKSSKSTHSNPKHDSSGSDSTTFSPNKARKEVLYKKLTTYSSLNNLEKITSNTYNLTKDIEGNENEIYIVEIPKDVPAQSLLDSVIFFDKPTVLNVEDNTYILNVNTNQNISHTIIMDSSKADDNYFNVLSIRPKGILCLCKDNKLKKKSLKIHKESDQEVIEGPRNLKGQHLLLGQDYEDRVKLDKWISDKLDGLITTFNKKHKEKKSKKKSIEKDVSNLEENLDIFKLLNEHTEKRSSFDDLDNSYTKKKKKKRKSDRHEETLTTEKSEMEESIDIINQLMLESEASHCEENPKKHKKEKRKRSKSIFVENPQPDPEKTNLTKRKRSKSLLIDVAEKSSEGETHRVPNITMKNKTSKTLLENVNEEVSSSDVSPKKQKKKGIVNSTMLSSVLENVSIFDEEQSVIRKPNKESAINSFIDGLVKGVDGVKEKKKKRKRKESDSEEVQLYEKKKRKPD